MVNLRRQVFSLIYLSICGLRGNTFELDIRSNLQAKFFEKPMRIHSSFTTFPFWRILQTLIPKF